MSTLPPIPPAPDALSLRSEQRVTGHVALAMVAFWASDVLVLKRFPWDTLAVRALWALTTLAVAWVWLPRVAPARRWVPRLLGGAVLPNVFYAVLMLQMGGARGPLFGWYSVMPIALVVLGRGDARVAWTGALSAVVLGGGLLVLAGLPWVSVALWTFVFAVGGVLGLQAAAFTRRVLEAEAERVETLRALADSQARTAEAERLAQVGRLAAGVAHEINNPLAFVRSNLQFLREEWGSPEADPAECEAAFRETVAGLERIRLIVQDLKSLARGADEQPQDVGECDLVEVLEETLRLASVRLKGPAAVARTLPPGLPRALADHRRLGQVLLNLLLNAADALEGAAHPEVHLGVELAGEHVRVVVEDNGPGIPPEHLPKLFTPFFTTKAPGKGTGLGLALSRQYVEGFGGTLRAEPRRDGRPGARFVVELVRARPARAA